MDALAVRAGPTRHPCHKFNEHEQTNIIVMLNVFGQHIRVGLRPHTRSNSNSITHQYKLTCCSSRVNMTPSHTFNEHKHAAAIVIVVHLDSISGWDYDLILCRTWITCSNLRNEGFTRLFWKKNTWNNNFKLGTGVYYLSMCAIWALWLCNYPLSLSVTYHLVIECVCNALYTLIPSTAIQTHFLFVQVQHDTVP